MTPEEIHNIWLHMSGKSEGLLEAGGKADFPVLFANAILEFERLNQPRRPTCMCGESWRLEAVHREKTPCFDYIEHEWVGLTDEEIEEVERWIEFKEEGSGRIPVGKLVRYIEAKLKEKNT